MGYSLTKAVWSKYIGRIIHLISKDHLKRLMRCGSTNVWTKPLIELRVHHLKEGRRFNTGKVMYNGGKKLGFRGRNWESGKESGNREKKLGIGGKKRESRETRPDTRLPQSRAGGQGL